MGCGRNLLIRLRRSPPGSEPPDESTHGPSMSLVDRGSAQGEQHALLVRRSEFQANEVREAAASESLIHHAFAACDRGCVAEHTEENAVLGERS